MPSVQADEIGLGNQEDLKCCLKEPANGLLGLLKPLTVSLRGSYCPEKGAGLKHANYVLSVRIHTSL